MQSARVWPRLPHTARPRPGTNIHGSHLDAGPTAADATNIYTHTTNTSTAAAFTALTAALSTDIC